MMNPVIAIHGGAGTILKQQLTPQFETLYHDALLTALRTGYHLLQKGAKSMDAVEAAIISLENFPLFNAGKGSVFTAIGTHEMDASIMDGTTLQAGAVAGVQKIKNPIAAAKMVLQRSEHVLLIGEGAEQFAHENGLVFEDESYFFTQQRFDQLQKAIKENKIMLDHDNTKKYGTVGAVALDCNGNLAAGTSTGGMTNKKFGRVGDTPIIGAGTYANNKTCAISCTGHGEYFMQHVVAYDVSCLMEYKYYADTNRYYTLAQAAEYVILNKLKKAGGEGGLIAIDKSGALSLPYNTAGMYRGWMRSEKDFFTGIF